MSKRVEPTIYNYGTERIIFVFTGFHAYIKEMHGSRNKISSGSVAWRDLIPASKG
jgi:hypothetical protein